jgi:hypothetical protein
VRRSALRIEAGLPAGRSTVTEAPRGLEIIARTPIGVQPSSQVEALRFPILDFAEPVFYFWVTDSVFVVSRTSLWICLNAA